MGSREKRNCELQRAFRLTVTLQTLSNTGRPGNFRARSRVIGLSLRRGRDRPVRTENPTIGVPRARVRSGIPSARRVLRCGAAANQCPEAAARHVQMNFRFFVKQPVSMNPRTARTSLFHRGVPLRRRHHSYISTATDIQLPIETRTCRHSRDAHTRADRMLAIVE